MEDARIVDLYWARSETAIAETAKKYGNYCYTIAFRILSSAEDADESVNDTYLTAWNTMPPHRPSALAAFLGKLTRRLSIDRWRARRADKRGGGELPLALEELGGCAAADSTEQTVEAQELAEAINRFLVRLPAAERDLFVCRYWFLTPVKELGARFHMSESAVKTALYRTRNKLDAFLQGEGYR